MTTTALAIPDQFASTMAEFKTQLAPLLAESRAIVVTSCDQVSAMKAAGEARRKLKGLRCAVERCRTDYKAEFLRKGREVDAFAATVKAQIEPEEKRLEEAETFAIRAEQARKAQLAKERAEALACYAVDGAFYNLADMPEDQFVSLLDKAISDQAEREDAAARAEEQRLRDEMKAKAEAAARAAEEQRIREENERLRKQAVENKRIADEFFAAEKARRDEESRKQHEEQRKAQAEMDAIVAAERKAREQAEEVAEAALAEARKIELARQQQIKAEEKARRKAAAAPDKDKLVALAETLYQSPLPDMATDEGRDVLRMVRDRLLKLAGEIVEKAGTL